MQTQRTTDEFRNEPFTDFSKPENAEAMRDAIEQVRSELGREYKNWVNGEWITIDSKFESHNPANKDQVIGIFPEVDDDAERIVGNAISAASKAFKTWKNVPAEERASYLFKAADIIRERKHYFSAWMIFETSKTWAEADGDTAEAIDFLEFYGREMIRWSQPQPVTKIEGEDNALEYIPLGVGAIIPPWNFPLAIMVGMTTAAIVAGNTVVLKPSSDSPTIAVKFIEVLEEVGLPAGVVNFVTGSAATGEAMVTDAKTRFISFTGSKQVGLHINEQAAKTREGQIWIKRVVAEMGGKDAIIVADDADLDAAAEGVVQAAFGFQGQKCSACSRLIVDEKVHDELMEKVLERTAKLKVGEPTEGDTNMAAVINKSAFDKTLEYIKIGESEGGKIVAGGSGNETQGFFIEPTIIDDVEPMATIEQEEIFAPVLAVIKARDYDHALEIANDTEFGLTGAVYSADQARLDRAKNEFHVGNLYLNRKCTGALVGVHPFGGFNMSGTDSKAGGREYLLQFMQAKSVSQKV
ncbi:MAG: L-glutamate gamma-semialdehyde dehydrogenase [Acidobacteria bacterium]|nr:MAG: L-glutamate gamma-semialdehyde dehydrogenase [Acidobacteriota bacterium]REK01294.1 MAG: L-glutamate gamma-semialdehyde dehydrogenase [Acidobacteriota bacterium]REK14250.1 MAG: L-glutamate gamma-semialdehyde dehydrogenase [Acidobacteriota bacterium]REK44965.1 MAG: L-glutamate gamma-semialdehyde dehydrogenase [Acidobacteriota bacterium]